MISVAILVSMLVALVLAEAGRLVVAGGWSMPAPATIVVLLAGFVMFSLRRRVV